MIIEKALLENAEEILELQKLAYLSEAETYNDYSIPPLTQTIDQIRADFENQLFLKASTREKIVGSVRGYMENDTCYIGRLIVHPDFQKRGIGTQLMKEIEEHFKQADRYELFTGHRSHNNIRLYNCLGYKIFKKQKVTDALTFVFMEKTKRTG
jgi:ribosomal protein S18 acetylase RimI-like enzyme